jgi:hypothetical protein
VKFALAALVLAAHVAPPSEQDLPRAQWTYIKGEAQVKCDGEPPYYMDLHWSQLNLESDGYGVGVVLAGRQEQEYGCQLDMLFTDGRHAAADPGVCGPKVTVLQARMQVVAPRVIYVRRYYDIVDPYEEGDGMHCRFFEVGYLQPSIDLYTDEDL